MDFVCVVCRKVSSNVTAAAAIEQSVRAFKGRLTRCARHPNHRPKSSTCAACLVSLVGSLRRTGRIERTFHGYNECKACALVQRSCRQERQDSDRRALLAGASTSREDVDRSAVALSHVRQGRRGVEEMLDQATHVLAGIGATRETLKACARHECSVSAASALHALMGRGMLDCAPGLT